MSHLRSSHSAYGAQFFSYTDTVSKASAVLIVPLIRNLLTEVASVADFGCARGTWLAEWKAAGITDIAGIDGDYVDPQTLLIPRTQFHAADLNGTIDLGRRFDLVCSLEVAEHLRPETSAGFVKNLTKHADIVVFSAAPPGQGGLNHINERPYDAWRDLFRQRGYDVFDAVRPRIRDASDVAYWYRYNLMLYANEAGKARFTSQVLATRIPDDSPIPDVSPALFRFRKGLLRMLPQGTQDWAARAKASLTA